MYGPLVDDRDSIAPGMVPQHSISQAGLSVAVSTGASQSMESLKIDEVVNSAEVGEICIRRRFFLAFREVYYIVTLVVDNF